MIVPMKKIAVIVQAKDSGQAVKNLRKLGVLHLEHQETPEGKETAVLLEEISGIDEALKILAHPEYISPGGNTEESRSEDWEFIVRHVIELEKRAEHLQEFSLLLLNKINDWEKWGDFDPEAVRALAKKNVFIGFYRIPRKDMAKVAESFVAEKLFITGGIVYCAVVSYGQKIDIGFKDIGLPLFGLNQMKERLAEDYRTIKVIKDEIRKFSGCRDILVRKKGVLEKDLEFLRALKGMGQSGEIQYIRGYIPYDSEDVLLQTAQAEKWGVCVRDPFEEENVPTLIRNPAWVSIISPVFKVIEVFPGYREKDISLPFLVFLSIFFAILIGDAGYGLVFLGATMFAHKKLGKKTKDSSVFILFYFFSFCAVVWGVLSGTFFGQEWLAGSFSPLVPALRDDKSVQTICFFLGAVHLSIGHFWRAVVKFPSLTALAEVGWAATLWGAFFLAKNLVSGGSFPGFAKWFFLIGLILVVFFTAPQRNFLKCVGAGMGNFLLNFVNSFTDVVSYVRLFAVGLATVAVADAFNKMALDVGFGGIIAAITASLILLLGHTLNIVFSPMAILVHGVRLNVLEFCNHMDIKWSGFPYRPFREYPGNLPRSGNAAV